MTSMASCKRGERGGLPNSVMSAPAMKVRPSHASTPALISLSASNCLTPSMSASRTPRLMALTGGLLIQMMPTSPRFSNLPCMSFSIVIAQFRHSRTDRGTAAISWPRLGRPAWDTLALRSWKFRLIRTGMEDMPNAVKWTKSQRNVVLAAYLGWTLDAFDFFLMVFMFKDISTTFGVSVKVSTTAVLLTLAARPVGAFVFGRLADRYGRKPTLMWNILAFSALEVLSGFAPTITLFLLTRFLFGIAMGGEWGIGSALTFETIPARARGVVSGLLQAGYPSGYFLASLAVFFFYDRLGWRYMFVLGAIPALLVFFVRRGVDESPAFIEQRVQQEHQGLLEVLRRNYKLALYAVALMTAFNFFSHGSQDAYPNLFLKIQHGFDTRTLSLMTAVANIGAIFGGIGFGWLSERIGRRRAIMMAALIALPVIPILGLRQHTAGAGRRRFFDPGVRARSVGHHPSAPQ